MKKRASTPKSVRSEVDPSISSQELQSPPIQQQVEQWTASQAVEINITKPFEPFQKSIAGNRIQVVFGIFLAAL